MVRFSAGQIAQLSDAEILTLMNLLVGEVQQRLSERTLLYSDSDDSDAAAENGRGSAKEQVPAENGRSTSSQPVPRRKVPILEDPAPSPPRSRRGAAQKSILERCPDHPERDDWWKRHRVV